MTPLPDKRGLLGRFDESDIEISNCTKYHPGNRAIEQFKTAGGKLLYIAHWTTNLNQREIRECASLMLPSTEFLASLSIENLPSGTAFLPDISFEFGDQLTFRAVTKTKFISGQHLRVIMMAEHDEKSAKSAIIAAGRNCIDSIRLIMGLPAAHFCSLESVINLTTGGSSVVAEFPISYELSDPEADLSPPIRFFYSGERLPEITISADVRALFRAAMEHAESWTRFLFLWIGIEILTDADGRKRSNFCRDILKSEEIDREMLRLRNIRVEINHYGSREVSGVDFASILWLFRICVMPECDLRGIMCLKYIEWLGARGLSA